MNSNVSFFSIPVEVWVHMAGQYLEPKDLARFAKVNRATYAIANTDLVWKNIIRRSWPAHLPFPEVTSYKDFYFGKETPLTNFTRVEIRPGPAINMTPHLFYDPTQTHEVLEFYKIPQNNRSGLVQIDSKDYFFQEEGLKISPIQKPLPQPEGFTYWQDGKDENIYQICIPTKAIPAGYSHLKETLQAIEASEESFSLFYEHAHIRIYNPHNAELYCKIPLRALAIDPAFASIEPCTVFDSWKKIRHIIGVNGSFLAFDNGERSITLFDMQKLQNIQELPMGDYEMELVECRKKIIEEVASYGFSEGVLYVMPDNESQILEYTTFEGKEGKKLAGELVPMDEEVSGFIEEKISSLHLINGHLLFSAEMPPPLTHTHASVYVQFVSGPLLERKYNIFMLAADDLNIVEFAGIHDGMTAIKGNFLISAHCIGQDPIQEVSFKGMEIFSGDTRAYKIPFALLFPDPINGDRAPIQLSWIRTKLSDHIAMSKQLTAILQIKQNSPKQREAKIIFYRAKAENKILVGEYNLGVLDKHAQPRLLGFNEKGFLLVQLDKKTMVSLEVKPDPASCPAPWFSSLWTRAFGKQKSEDSD